MTNQKILDRFQEQMLISTQEAKHIIKYEETKPFSLHYELRLILYLGILLLSSGLGVVIYQNLNSLGHTVIVVSIALLVMIAFGLAIWKRSPFTWSEVKQTNTLSDFSLLLGCLSFLTLEGYLQYQYQFFGEKYGLVTFIPAVVFFFCTYYFDHRGVLSMAITALASWVGVSIAPFSAFSKNDFTASHFILTAISLGLLLSVVALLSEYKNLKKHFAFTYLLMGSNLALIAALAGVFNSDVPYFYAFVVWLISCGLVVYAQKKQSYLFFLMGIIFAYIVFTKVFFDFLPNNESTFWFGAYYFIASGIGMVILLTKLRNILKTKN
jgi:Predicted membrane protein (DUF2157)